MNEKQLEKLKQALPDTQNQKDSRGKKINKVGIRNLLLPIKVYVDGNNSKTVDTVGDFSIYCNLDEHVKGASMSRFVEILHDNIEQKKVSIDLVKGIMNDIKTKLESTDGYVKVRFVYFIKKKAPVSEKEGYVSVPCILEGKDVDDVMKLYLNVQAYFSSACPCSKAISKNSAHNQPSTADVKVELKDFVSIEDIVDIVERCASCEIYSILKRVDEKYVTEKAYDNPKFVEDMGRDISIELDKLIDKQINDYVVVINHDESIHQHKAVAIINAGRELK